MAIFVLVVLGVFTSVNSDVGSGYSTPPSSYDAPFQSEDQSVVTVSTIHEDLPAPTLLTSIVQGGAGLDLEQEAPFNISDTQQQYGPDSKSSSETEVQKHFYFFSDPEGPEEIQTRMIAPPVPIKKNVKILFIKASTPEAAPVQIPVLPQNDEKTLVYVLVKKPEETSIILPTATPAKPIKPEVFFIKYAPSKESHDVVAKIQRSDGNVDSVTGGTPDDQEVMNSTTPQPSLTTEINNVHGDGLPDTETGSNATEHEDLGIYEDVDNAEIQSANAVLPVTEFPQLPQIYGPPKKR